MHVEWIRSHAVCSKASWASTSKQAMYSCAVSVSMGHVARTSSMVHDSLNHAKPLLAQIQPPMPTWLPSAIASAALRHCNSWGWCSGMVLLCLKSCSNQSNASLLCLRRCTSLRLGSAESALLPRQGGTKLKSHNSKCLPRQGVACHGDKLLQLLKLLFAALPSPPAYLPPPHPPYPPPTPLSGNDVLQRQETAHRSDT